MDTRDKDNYFKVFYIAMIEGIAGIVGSIFFPSNIPLIGLICGVGGIFSILTWNVFSMLYDKKVFKIEIKTNSRFTYDVVWNASLILFIGIGIVIGALFANWMVTVYEKEESTSNIVGNYIAWTLWGIFSGIGWAVLLSGIVDDIFSKGKMQSFPKAKYLLLPALTTIILVGYYLYSKGEPLPPILFFGYIVTPFLQLLDDNS